MQSCGHVSAIGEPCPRCAVPASVSLLGPYRLAADVPVGADDRCATCGQEVERIAVEQSPWLAWVHVERDYDADHVARPFRYAKGA